MSILPIGDGLEKATATLRVFAAKAWLPELAQRVSAGAMRFVADEFNTSTDPYGREWAPLKRERTRDRRARLRAIKRGKTPRGPKVLIHTGRMRASAGASPFGNTARLVIPTWYAKFHQEGSFRRTFSGPKMMSRRMMLPDESRGTPEKWNAMITMESRKLLQEKAAGR
jgi:hypothetical protein